MYVFCVVAFLLRLWALDAQSLWWDEAISLHLAELPLAELLADRAAHVHPPLYFVLLKVWSAVAGINAFSARFLSVWFNVLLVAALYAFGRRSLGYSVGLVAAGVATFLSLYVVYSQEARVYALLPLVYLAIIAALRRLDRSRERFGARERWSDWAFLVLAETAGLYLHYTSVLVVTYVNLVILLDVARRRWPRKRVGCWLISLVLVGILCLPWSIAVFVNRGAVQADAGIDDPFTEALPLGFFVRLIWLFQWTGLTGIPVFSPMYYAAVALGVLLLFGLGLLISQTGIRASGVRLLADWSIPLLPAVLLWQAKPLSHPRYLIVLSSALVLFFAYVVVATTRIARPRWLGQVLAGGLVLAFLTITALALFAWFFDPRYGKDDVRGLAAWLEQEARRGDVIVVPWGDWTLDYAYRGSAVIIRPDPLDETSMWRTLSSTVGTGNGSRVFLVTYRRGTRDRRGLLSFAFEAAGHLAETKSFRGLVVRMYELEHPLAPPFPNVPVAAGGLDRACFGSLCLCSAWVEQGAPADTAVAVAFRWQLARPVDERYRVSLRLWDEAGCARAMLDDWLLNANGEPSDRWSANEDVNTYHVLPLTEGTPPLSYTLFVEVYAFGSDAQVRPVDLVDVAGNPAGRVLVLGVVSLAPARGSRSGSYGVPADIPLLPDPVYILPGLVLEGVRFDREQLTLGQFLMVVLRWRALDTRLPDLQPSIQLVCDGQVLAVAGGAPLAGRYPTDRWRAGEVVVECRQLLVPADAEGGLATVVLEWDGQKTTVGEVTIEANKHVFEAPILARPLNVRLGDVAELLGYELSPAPYRVGRPITLTLYWRALEGASEADYVVFTHLLAADGHLVAQHDGIPVAQTRPTRGWVAGEILVDQHVMEFREVYVGPARIEVGLYDSATLVRVPVQGNGDAFLLPETLTVVP